MEDSESEVKCILFSFVAYRSMGLNTEMSHGVSSIETNDSDTETITLAITTNLKETYPESLGWSNDVILIFTD